MSESSSVRSTYERALDMLEARARGSDELRRRLLRKGEPEAEVDAAIARLTEAGLLDDANYARQMARSKALGSGQSRRRIQQDLARRGVDREIASDAIDQVFADEGVDDAITIERVARKKFRTLSKLDAVAQKQRLYGFLARRGYDGDDIARVLRVILVERDTTTESE
ncbi:MAG: regulatory protein RecX [Gemmatimonadaceae bacterium]